MFVRPVHQAYRTALLQTPYSPTCRAPLPRFRRARAPRTAPFRRYSGYSGVTLYALRFTLYALNMHMWTLHLTCTVQYSTLAGPCHLSTSGHHKLLYITTLAHIPDGRVSMTLVCVRCSSPPPPLHATWHLPGCGSSSHCIERGFVGERGFAGERGFRHRSIGQRRSQLVVRGRLPEFRCRAKPRLPSV